MNIILRLLVVVFLDVCVGMGCALADCAKDRAGTVYCSQQPGGGAARDNSGNVQCGQGQCRRDRGGAVRCSVVSGGGAETDNAGTVQCLGGCSLASSSMCVKGSE